MSRKTLTCKMWHIVLEQVLSEFITKRYELVIISDCEGSAISGVLHKAYENNAFTPNLPYKVLHAIRWN